MADIAEGDTDKNKIKIVCVSDTHLQCPDVPDGDLLVHAGDMANYGTFDEMQGQLNWLGSLPHAHKIVIGGNHDRILDPSYIAEHPKFKQGGRLEDLEWHDLKYLCNESTAVSFPHLGRSLKVYGSPLTPKYESVKGGAIQYYTWAFNYPRVMDVWTNTVPDDVDLFIVHGPPRGHLDEGGKGCPHLLRELWRVRPPLVVFGHMHHSRGTEKLIYDNWEAWANDQVNMIARPPGRLRDITAGTIRFRTGISQALGRCVERGNGRASSQLVNASHQRDSGPIVVYL
ncbi:hypothetical protein CspHIS471_0506360 [Cutaneotrichosporon sp. HIS471]|nr:hypothetical protein CspHIS471_0506360 [Cutaneotrichosporon sp. HIS471]